MNRGSITVFQPCSLHRIVVLPWWYNAIRTDSCLVQPRKLKSPSSGPRSWQGPLCHSSTMTTEDCPSPQISRKTVKSLAKLDLAICSLGDQNDISNFTGRRSRDASIWQRRARQAGTLLASHSLWPKAAVHQQAICYASAPTMAWDSIFELVTQ